MAFEVNLQPRYGFLPALKCRLPIAVKRQRHTLLFMFAAWEFLRLWGIGFQSVASQHLQPSGRAQEKHGFSVPLAARPSPAFLGFPRLLLTLAGW